MDTDPYEEEIKPCRRHPGSAGAGRAPLGPPITVADLSPASASKVKAHRTRYEPAQGSWRA
jgi:hypothetical protein